MKHIYTQQLDIPEHTSGTYESGLTIILTQNDLFPLLTWNLGQSNSIYKDQRPEEIVLSQRSLCKTEIFIMTVVFLIIFFAAGFGAARAAVLDTKNKNTITVD
jgi:hypothetical protein